MPDIVVDIGNSRMKWGRCVPNAIDAIASLPVDSPEIWAGQLADWGFPGTVRWAVASVQPATRSRFLGWVLERRETAYIIDNYEMLSLNVGVQNPGRVGIDRLLDAVGANARRTPGRAAIVIDAGTAVTIDLIDAKGTFRGGFIIPGLRLMAKALNEHTAQLPLISDFGTISPLPPDNTSDAIREGVRWSLIGGIDRLVRLLAEYSGGYDCADQLLTGGDARYLTTGLPAAVLCPGLTLEGIRLVAEAQQ